MSTFFDDLERELVRVAGRPAPARRARRSLPAVLLACVACLSAGAATAGATLYVLRGSVIPAPAARDVPPDQLPVAGTSVLSALRAPDPAAGQPPWGLRLSRTATGLLCSAVGQVRGVDFGLVGLDGRFRTMPERVVDGCGEVRAGRLSLAGARIFDARLQRNVRSVVYAVGGDDLRRATLTAGGRSRDLRIAHGGVVLAALRGYPEDSGAELTLRFAGGRVERQPFGSSPFIATDPGGGSAWKVQAMGAAVAPGAQEVMPPHLRLVPPRAQPRRRCDQSAGLRRAAGTAPERCVLRGPPHPGVDAGLARAAHRGVGRRGPRRARRGGPLARRIEARRQAPAEPRVPRRPGRQGRPGVDPRPPHVFRRARGDAGRRHQPRPGGLRP